ncbi:kinase-like domain-containing protein [Scleroderma yunnanense]
MDTLPQVPPIKYTAHLGTRLQKDKAAAGRRAFDFPEDPRYVGQWIVGECIGVGASGRVRIVKHRRSGQLAALKILPLQPIIDARVSLATRLAKSDKQRLGIDREIIILKLMDHPNIMRIYDVFEGERELYLVLEYVEGGELFDFLANHGGLPPMDALAFFKQIVYGLNYAHTFSITHRDLKPENILIQSLTPPLIKIADWGMAAFAPPTMLLETSCGSPHYASPEIINGLKYQGCATDVWSCGVILYALLTGRLPFQDQEIPKLLAKVRTGKYEVPKFVDPQAKDLLKRMLVVDPTARITLPEIIAHPWFNQFTPTIPYVPPPTVSELAQPLASEEIDDNLLQCLLVIWGKNGNVETIKADLFSPQGSLAKTFYFLLRRHREQALGDHGTALDSGKLSTFLPGKIVTKRYQSPTLSKSNKFEVQQLSPALRVQTNYDLLPSGVPSSNPCIRGPSPSEPRLPRIRPVSPSMVAVVPTRHKRIRNASVSVGPSNAHIEVGVHRTCSVSTRHTQANQDPRNYNTHDHQPHQVVSTRQLSNMRSFISPVARNSVQPVLNPNIANAPATFASGIMRDDMSISGSPTGRRHDLVEPYPVTQDHDLQYPIHVRRDAYIPAASSIHSQPRGRHGHAFAVNDTRSRRAEEDKENVSKFGNQSLRLDTDWTHHPRGVFVKSNRGPTRQENGNNSLHVQRKPVERSKGQEKRERTPTIDLSLAKRPVLGSLHQVSTPSPSTLAFPIGEFKGWFSNLFHWKPHTYMLYSIAPLRATRNETIRILEQFGVEIDIDLSEAGHYDVRQSHANSTSVLHCQAHELVDRSNGVAPLKYVRFRVEFSSSMAAQDGFLTPPPLLATSTDIGSHTFRPPVFGAAASTTSTMSTSSRHIANKATGTTGVLDPACAIVLVQEKGSGSTFRVLCQQFRDVWTLDTMVSPSLGGSRARTSFVGHQQRLVIT